MKTFINFTIFSFLSIAILAVAGCDKDDSSVDPKQEEPTSLRVGLVGHWDFLGNANDLSTEDNDGAVIGAIPAKDRNGKANSAYEFNGESDYVQLGNIKPLGFGGFSTYAIAAWVKPDSMGGIIASKWNGGISAGWYLRVKSNGICSSYRNVVPWATEAVEPIQPNKWHHVLTQYDGSKLYIYVNGELVAQEPFTSHPNDVTTNVLIGANHSHHVVSGFFKGVIDEVRIYNRDLTKEEIDWLASH